MPRHLAKYAFLTEGGKRLSKPMVGTRVSDLKK